jgi:hypothetical protein
VVSEIPNSQQLLRNLARALLAMRDDPQLLRDRNAIRSAVRRLADVVDHVADEGHAPVRRDDDLAGAKVR